MKPRRFTLSDSFIEPYKTMSPPWGQVGYVTYKRTYARPLSETDPDLEGTEEWYQTCKRVIEGMFSIQKKHILSIGTEWNDQKAQRTAKEAYDRLFHMKWMPPGRGLWLMGTEFIENKTAAGLYNCAFTTTKGIAEKGGEITQWIMDALMLGIGVGFDTLGANSLIIKEPNSVPLPNNYFTNYIYEHVNTVENGTYVIADSRQGWAQATRYLLDSIYFGYTLLPFDYTRIRGPGEPIKGFGGISSGPAPLIELHESIRELYKPLVGLYISSVDIVDTNNLVGRCVVAGNIRRSAEIALGNANDKEFLTMKNNQELLNHHRWCSNNSFIGTVGMDYTWHAEQMVHNGEPGVVYLDNMRAYGRMKDGPTFADNLVVGVNPCGEIPLEDRELCNVPETFPAFHDSFEDYKKTLKIAYLYGKTVSLTRTEWPATNAVMQKNRRIGLSQSGIVQAINRHGYNTMINWSDKGYEFLTNLDKKYSDWFCIPKSKKLTSIKPSGTVSLLNGATPGIHFPEDEYYIRRMRFASNSELLPALRKAGYSIEQCQYSPGSMVVSFPVKEQWFVRGKRDISMWEQIELAAQYQNVWADNSVSVTITFKDYEAKDIAKALQLYETKVKALSFLKYKETGYVQAPYEPITKEEYYSMSSSIELNIFNTSESGSGEKFCDGDSCQIDFSKYITMGSNEPIV